jgi:sulfatase modifying factor 1
MEKGKNQKINGMDFVFIPGDEFDMGDVFGDGKKNEKPVHKVRLDDFYLGQYQVTFDQFDKFCKATGRELPADEGWGRGRRPVINVTWFDASDFCRWIAGQAGKAIRLPTEAEWEYAAREGGKKVLFGNGKDMLDPLEINFNSLDWKSYHSASGISRNKTTPVGSFEPNSLGLYDMTGNVWEWCLDLYDEHYYEKSPEQNPPGPDYGTFRIIRGGSYFDPPYDLRCTMRHANNPVLSYSTYGFRCAMII